jgi:hypothetical protein
MSYIIIFIITLLLFPVLVGAVSSFLSGEKGDRLAKKLEEKLGDRFPKS